ncbi:MAG TPA: acyl-CoA dehydrogenase family protein [Acidimicrobiales bacterium]|nr:acyl-CoA dehydrogenase family protein [Acidimicrobiales bacterium]
MDFSFTEEQQEIAGLARRILSDRVTVDLLKEVEAAPDRFDRGVWDELAKAGLLAIALPADVGGGGYGVVEQCLVLEEVGRAIAPVPVLASIVMGAAPIAEFGSEEQKRRWVEPAAEGRAILTGALADPVHHNPAAPSTTATRADGGWRLQGVKTAVPAGPLADLFLVPARVDGGVAVFLVEPGAEGVTLTRQRTTNRDSAGYLELSGCVVPDDAVLGSVEDGPRIVEWIDQRATIGLCAMQLGITEQALAETAEYTKTRVQFERPIATFQAVGHRCADCYIDVEGVRLTLWQAAWRLSEGLPAAVDVEVAKFWAAEAGHRVAHAAVHLHGGMGVANEYPIHRRFVWAKQVEFMLGGATEQLLRIGEALASEPA